LITVLYFGSFNPVHNGHIAIANYIASLPEIEELWFVVSPLNPFKKNNKNLIDVSFRIKMLELAVKEHPLLKVSDVELHLPQPSYTIDTLESLSGQYEDKSFALLMGLDSFKYLDMWKSYQKIISSYIIYVYPRAQESRLTHADIPFIQTSNIVLLDAPFYTVSSTEIRDKLRNEKDTGNDLPKSVLGYIQKEKLYR